LAEGECRKYKITRPVDMMIAERILEDWRQSSRVFKGVTCDKVDFLCTRKPLAKNSMPAISEPSNQSSWKIGLGTPADLFSYEFAWRIIKLIPFIFH